jgi:hypothetical protein
MALGAMHITPSNDRIAFAPAAISGNFQASFTTLAGRS